MLYYSIDIAVDMTKVSIDCTRTKCVWQINFLWQKICNIN